MKRKLPAILLIFAISVSLLASCSNQQRGLLAETQDTIDEPEKEQISYMGQGEVGNKWLASSIYGAVTEDTVARIQDDLMVGATKDYLASLTIEPGKSYAGVLKDCDDIMLERTMNLLTDENLRTDSFINSHEVSIIQNLYDMAMDWETRNAIGIMPIQTLVETISAIDDMDELSEFLLDCRDFVSTICNVGVGASLDNVGFYTVFVEPISLRLGDSAEYDDPSESSQKGMKRFDGVVNYMLNRMGWKEEEVEKAISDFWMFETFMASHIITREEQYQDDYYDRIINIYSLDEIRAIQGSFPVDRFIERKGMENSHSYDLTEPDWLQYLGSELYTEENIEMIKNYLIADLCFDSAYWTDRDAYDEYMRLYYERYGIDGEISDEEQGRNYVDTLLSDVVDNVYIRKYCTPDEKQQVIDLIENIIEEYKLILQSEDWLSEETKQKALRKLDTMTYKAIYPDELQDFSGLSFALKEEGGNFLQAIEAIGNYEEAKAMQYVDQPINSNVWSMSIRDANAYYDASENCIVILAGQAIGQFSLDAPYEQVLAAVGATTIGHEISHAFDTSGALFDETGAYNEWWTTEDYKAFDERAQKLIDYYNKIIPWEGASNVKGDIVKGEAIADMGGLKVSLAIASHIDNFDYALFFKEFAKSWAIVETFDVNEQALELDEHPLSYLRINTVAPQFQEFYDTFNVQPEDGMYLAPEARISVW